MDIGAYEAAGGYRGLRAALALDHKEVQELVKKSGLRGRGGAGFPTGLKWSFVPEDPEHKHYFLVNADEKEPGTMKDRILMEGDPHQLIEGTIISAYAVRASNAVIFLRREYARSAEVLRKALEEARSRGYIGERIMGSHFSLDIQLHLSVGRYMCGEETGLLNAMEGRRATPRNKPPFPQVAGLWARPTVVNNVETVCNIPHILREGCDWFMALAEGPDRGTKLYGISGKVKRPGVWELPIGATLREVLELAGGMADGLALRGWLPGGGSTDFLTAEHLDVKMDFDSLPKAGSRLGTGTVIVLDDRTCPVGMVLSLEKFFARESCGFCTPCREGLPWVARTLAALEEGRGEPGDLGVLRDQVDRMAPGRTFCALAPGAMEPLQSALTYFGDDFQAHIRDKRCPHR